MYRFVSQDGKHKRTTHDRPRSWRELGREGVLLNIVVLEWRDGSSSGSFELVFETSSLGVA